MHNVLGVDYCFVHGSGESIAARPAGCRVRCTVVVGCSVSRAGWVVLEVIGCFNRHRQVLEVGVNVTNDVLLGPFAFAFIYNHSGNLGHVYPVQLKCFRVTDKHLIAILDGVAENTENTLVKLVQLDPLL